MPPRIPVFIPSARQLQIAQEACVKLEKENAKLHKDVAKLSVRNSALITQIADLTVKHMVSCTRRAYWCPNCSAELDYRRKRVKFQPTTTLELVSPPLEETPTSYFDDNVVTVPTAEGQDFSFDELADAANEYLASVQT